MKGKKYLQQKISNKLPKISYQEYYKILFMYKTIQLLLVLIELSQLIAEFLSKFFTNSILFNGFKILHL